YFQIDTVIGTFTKAVEQSRTATTLTANATPPALQPGLHIIYFFATDGSDATSINPSRPQKEKFGNSGFDMLAPESSSVIGGINAYLFLVAPAGPTAANVSIGGRVLTSKGRGIRNAIVTLINQNGETRSARTSAFGFYRFADVQAGETYILSVTTKRYVFDNPTRVLSITDELTDVDFIASP
ncbi:MAG: carboxypeptidase-like regulatory domain-containing protein, partial [Acidobacteriota bacterium]